jgi:HPt (histidine-containing phosphotransfer) domain-containing protein
VQVAGPWPEIDGIDSADASSRWCGDVRLFSTLLERMLEEFLDVDLPATVRDPGARNVHIRRMHRLRGGACMLGAKAVSELAGEVEAAYEAEEMSRAADLTTQLTDELRRVRRSAETSCFAARVDADEALMNAAELDPYAIVELETLLRQKSLAALDLFSALSPQLRRTMGSVHFGRIRGYIDTLEFDEAANELKELRET